MMERRVLLVQQASKVHQVSAIPVPQASTVPVVLPVLRAFRVRLVLKVLQASMVLAERQV